jgi:hypothetical protein
MKRSNEVADFLARREHQFAFRTIGSYTYLLERFPGW